MKGIILAGGSGSRLQPLTLAISKQLLPVGDKPLIYYPLSVLMLAGIRDILVITTPRDLPSFRRLLGDGSHLGIRITFAEQDEPRGLADALIIGADHIKENPVTLILGDNIFHGHSFHETLRESVRDVRGCVLFGYSVTAPERFGVGEVDEEGRLLSIEEKPDRPKSNRAIVGLYMYDERAVEIARSLRPSARGELEITDVNRFYVNEGSARLVDLGRGFAWLDAGTPVSLMQAGQYVHALETQQGIRIACVEEVALHMGYIDAEECHRLGWGLGECDYGRYVRSVVIDELEGDRDR